MSATPATGLSAVLRRRAAGVAFLLVLVGLVGLSIAFYTKQFTRVVQVSLETDRIGNQLTAPADVKMRGLIVGEARSVSVTDDGGAVIELALDPALVDLIPRNVEARLNPKTLFGEKFVDLVEPGSPTRERLAEGDVIPQDRSQAARETQAALDGLLPLLQELRPEALSTTLNAVSSALRGRGDRIGENLVLVDDYLREFNPELPELQQNLRGLADFTDTLDAASPDLLSVLDDFAFSSRSLVDQETALRTFLTSTTGFSDETTRFLDENEQRLVTLARDSVEPLQLYARYSPLFPCLATGLAESEQFISDSFGGLQPGLHITLEFVENRAGYQPAADEPAYLDQRPPDCWGLPNPQTPAGDDSFRDGFRPDDTPEGAPDGGQGSVSAAAVDPVRALATPSAQRRLLDGVVAPVLGVSPDNVPDLAHLLFGPMARGTAVGLVRGTS